MKKFKTLLSLSVCAFILLSGCTNQYIFSSNENMMNNITADGNQTNNFVNGESSPPPSYTAYKSAAYNFTQDMLLKTYNSKKNSIYSVGLYNQLSLLEVAAGGKTQQELKSIVGKELSVDSLCQSTGYFTGRLNALNHKEDKYGVYLENLMVLDSDIIADSDFLIKNADYFTSDIYRTDFSEPTNKKKISNHIDTFKSGKIDSAAPSFDGDIISVGTSLIKDSWLDGYSEDSITKGEFKCGNGETTEATYMESTEYYLENKNFKGFIKDFKNTPCRFLALLPKDGTDLKKAINSLDYENYNKLLKSFSVFSTCKAKLPQFSAKTPFENSFKNIYDLDIFKGESDFSGLSYMQKAKVADIKSAASIKITSGGVNTSKVKTSKSTKKDPDKEVVLSEPFIYIIADNESNIPIFAGVVTKI